MKEDIEKQLEQHNKALINLLRERLPIGIKRKLLSYQEFSGNIFLKDIIQINLCFLCHKDGSLIFGNYKKFVSKIISLIKKNTKNINKFIFLVPFGDVSPFFSCTINEELGHDQESLNKYLSLRSTYGLNLSFSNHISIDCFLYPIYHS